MKNKILSLCIIITLMISCSTSQIIPPVLVSENKPFYPLEAELNGLEGKSKLLIKVSADGVVVQVVIRQSAGSEILDNAAIDYANKLVFSPALEDEQPVEVWLSWIVNFTQDQLWSLNNFDPLYDVLVFIKTAGYRHESIQEGVNALVVLAEQNDFDLDVTSKSDSFDDDVLVHYEAVIFLNTSGDVLNTREQAAFEKYIRRGGGFVGIHAAVDTEYDWQWYGGLIGSYFSDHPDIQSASISVVDQTHGSTAHLPQKWERTDEWYNLKNDLPNDINVLALLDESTYEGGKNGNNHPFSWNHEYDGGRSWVTLGGHTLESYKEPLFLNHILGGIKYAAGIEK